MTKINSHKKLKHSAIAIACGMALFSGNVLAKDVVFDGRVTDSSNTVYFEGAKINIKELDISAISMRDGSFRFPQIEEGEYTLEITYLGVPKVERKITIDTKSIDFLHNILIEISIDLII